MNSNKNSNALLAMLFGYINVVFDKRTPTEKEFSDAADTVREANKSIAPVSDKEFENIKKKAREHIVVQQDVDRKSVV